MPELRILVVSHSLVHLRQQLFFRKWVEKKEDTTILMVGPRYWHNMGIVDHSDKRFEIRGLPCRNDGMLQYYTLTGLYELAERFKPNIVYSQSELWASQSANSLDIARALKAKSVLFVWENILPPKSDKEKFLLDNYDLIFYGNEDAGKLLRDTTLKPLYRKVPQVGVDTDLFKPMNVMKKYNVVYAGRNVPEKGVEMISKACSALGLSFNVVTGIDYKDVPKAMNEGFIFVSCPVDTPLWKEQSGSYTNLEAMACGIPVISTKSGAIPEYLEDNALLIKQNSMIELTEALQKLISVPGEIDKLGDKGRRHVLKKYSNEAVVEEQWKAISKLLPKASNDSPSENTSDLKK